jgi:hypothetical protein
LEKANDAMVKKSRGSKINASYKRTLGNLQILPKSVSHPLLVDFGDIHIFSNDILA